ncbi:MAG: TIGR00730 family Rossman fold protein [Elusimicrobiota bacterium]
MNICVYAASSRSVDAAYLDAAGELGRRLAENGHTVIYGGGSVGLMGSLADGALAAKGQVIGIIPEFMQELEWGHKGVSELKVVNDIHERKKLMMESADALCALPGGTGTFEELLEAITWKRLGLFLKPIVIVNIRGYYDPLIAQLEKAVVEKFLDERHRDMWRVAAAPADVLPAIESSPPWDITARGFAGH